MRTAQLPVGGLRRLTSVVLLAGVVAGCTAATPAAGPSGSRLGAQTAEQTTSRDAQLMDAAGRGDTGAVRRLLADGARLDARDQQGRTALIAAAYGNRLDAARTLIDAGADVNAQDDSRQSAYLIATSEVGDDVRLLELTLASGADVQAKDSYNGTGLIRAADRGYPRITARLLRAGVQVDHVNRLGWTALLEAVVLGDGSDRYAQTVRLLLDGGADPRLADRDGVTPLAHAQARDQRAVVALLRASAPD